MKSYVFKAKVEADRFEDGREAYHASCPALSGCHTWGYTPDEALANLRDAIELYVEDLVQSGQPLQIDNRSDVVELDSPSVVVNL